MCYPRESRNPANVHGHRPGKGQCNLKNKTVGRHEFDLLNVYCRVYPDTGHGMPFDLVKNDFFFDKVTCQT